MNGVRGAKYGGGGGRSPHIPMGYSGRAAGDTNPFAAGQLVNAVVTSLVLSTTPRQNFGNAIDAMMPWEQAPGWQYTIPTIGNEDLRWFDTERAAFAEFRHTSFSYGGQVGQLHRFGFKGIIDRDQQTFAMPNWQFGRRAANLARNIVRLDSYMQRIQMIKDTSNYGTVITITPGSGNGFNLSTATVDLFSAVSQICSAMEASLGIDRSEFTVALLGSQGKQGALEDFQLRKKFNSGSNYVYPTYALLATYLGVKDVVFSNPVYVADVNSSQAQVFGSGGMIAVYYNAPSSSNVIDTMDPTWARTFHYGPQDGVALEPFFDANTTTWNYPWELYQDPHIFVPQAAGVIVGPYQTS